MLQAKHGKSTSRGRHMQMKLLLCRACDPPIISIHRLQITINCSKLDREADATRGGGGGGKIGGGGFALGPAALHRGGGGSLVGRGAGGPPRRPQRALRVGASYLGRLV